MAKRRTPARTPAPPKPAVTGGDTRGIWLSLALILVTVAAYWSLKNHTFLQFDDADYVTENGAVRAGLTAAGLRWAFTTPWAGNWHPLTWISHMTDVQLFGMDAGWHHVTNLVLHVLTTVLLFWTLARVTGSMAASAFVAALFAVHPLHVESVAWIAERKDVLSTFWWMVAVSAYVSYATRGGSARYALLIVCFGLALLSKPMVVTLPFLLLLLDAWPLGRWARAAAGGRGRAALVLEKVPLMVMAIALAAWTFVVQRQAGAVQSLDSIPLPLRLAKVPVAYVHYLVTTIWPVNLGVLYPYPESIPLWQTAGALLILLAITIAAWRLRRSQPYLLVGWLWFLGTLVPVIGVIQAGSQPYADRFMYVPAIGLFIMAAWGVAAWLRAHPAWSQVALGAGLAIVLASAVVTFRQAGYWQDSVTLWQRTVDVTADNYRAQTNLGFALAEAGQRSRAMQAYQDALRLNPAYPNAHNYYGTLLADMGDFDRAAAEYEEALRLRPRFAEAHNSLGLTRVNQDRVDDGIREFTAALAIDPGFVPARNNLGIAYVHQDRYDLAIPAFEEAVRQQPGSAESQVNLATALAAAGRKRDALDHFAAAARLDGDPIRVHYAWGGVLMDLGDMPGAIEHFQTVLSLSPSYAPAVHDLGLSLAQSGHLNEGIDALQSAVRLDPQNADYHHDLGAALARRGLIPQAIAEMQAALAINPSHVEALEALKILTKKS